MELASSWSEFADYHVVGNLRLETILTITHCFDESIDRLFLSYLGLSSENKDILLLARCASHGLDLLWRKAMHPR